MQNKKIYLLQQFQLIEYCEQKKVEKVEIERISLKKWYPIFYVNGGSGEIVRCSSRPEKINDLRTWADLRVLADFLNKQCGIDECLLKLSDSEG